MVLDCFAGIGPRGQLLVVSHHAWMGLDRLIQREKKKKGASSDIDGTDKVDDRLLHWCSSVQAA